MKQTLLEMVQDILSETNGDEVNSIFDTVESEQVARVIRRAYQDMADELNLPSTGDLITLEDATSPVHPTRFRIPERTDLIDWIKYGQGAAEAASIDEDTDSVATGDNFAGSGVDLDLVIDGVAASGGVATFDAPVNITFTQTTLDGVGADLPGTITITGTLNGEPVVEEIDFLYPTTPSGVPSLLVTSTNTYTTVTAINFFMLNAPDSLIIAGNSAASLPAGLSYVYIPRKDVYEFNRLVDFRSSDDSNVQVVEYGPDNVKLNIRNDKFPEFWFSPDDEYIIFDSWDSTEETTMIAGKLKVYAFTAPTFSLTDTAVPELPSNLFPYLYAKAKSVYLSNEQRVDPKAEQTENRMRIRSQRNKWRQGRLNYEGPNFGKR